MKKTLILSLALLSFSLSAAADTIVFKDGMRVDASRVWVEKKEVRCEIGGIVFGYPKADVERIEKGRSEIKKSAVTVIKVHKEVKTVPEKETAVQHKGTASPDKKTAMPGQKPVPPPKKELASKRETSASSKKTVAAETKTVIPEKKASFHKEPQSVPPKPAVAEKKKKVVPVKKIPAAELKKSPKTAPPQYAAIPSFKEIINEDDNNPPAFIKRRRVLLVPRGLSEPQIRALLLSYEKKLRNELNAQKVAYKLIVVWVYDDFEKADEGAAGWLGMITNEQKSGALSDKLVLTIR